MPKHGGFENKHSYLEIVFSLLYEDAVQDLRKGIYFLGKQDSELVL